MPVLRLPGGEAIERLRLNRATGRWWFAESVPAQTRALGASERLRAKIFEPKVTPSFAIAATDRIFTIGSCFAREVEEALEARGLHVASDAAPLAKLASTATPQLEDWSEETFRKGYINKYTIGTMVDEIRWALPEGATDDFPSIIEVEPGRFIDLAAHNILAGFDRESVVSRRLLVRDIMREIYRSDVIVITLGLAEGWRDVPSGSSVVDAPISFGARDTDRFELEVLSHREVVEGLEAIAALLDAHGRPNWRMVISVSPVPLLASFTGDDIVTANSYSKAVLRSAAEEFARAHDRVDYFPSYEMAFYSDVETAWKSDRRHIQRSFVDAIIDLFCRSYLAK